MQSVTHHFLALYFHASAAFVIAFVQIRNRNLRLFSAVTLTFPEHRSAAAMLIERIQRDQFAESFSGYILLSAVAVSQASAAFL